MANRDSIVDKVKAMLAKTTENGCTEEEALAALAKARAWIDAHEITDEELQLSREEKAILHDESEADARDTHGIKWSFGRGVGRFCNVKIYRDGSKAGLSFIGFRSDIDQAIWLLDHLADFVHDKLFEFLLDCLAPDGKQRKQEIRGFVTGITERINSHLMKMCDPVQDGHYKVQALVVIKEQAVEDFMRAEGICLRESRSSASFSEDAFASGQSAGDRADFARPVSGAGATLRIAKN